MRVSHAARAASAVFDDRNLVSCGGLVPVLGLAERRGLGELVAEKVSLAVRVVRTQLKVPALVAGMVAGADSIEDMDLLRHGVLVGEGRAQRPCPTSPRSCHPTPRRLASSASSSTSPIGPRA